MRDDLELIFWSLVKYGETYPLGVGQAKIVAQLLGKDYSSELEQAGLFRRSGEPSLGGSASDAGSSWTGQNSPAVFAGAHQHGLGAQQHQHQQQQQQQQQQGLPQNGAAAYQGAYGAGVGNGAGAGFNVEPRRACSTLLRVDIDLATFERGKVSSLGSSYSSRSFFQSFGVVASF